MASRTELSDDVTIIKTWLFQWNMNFNPASSKQTQEVIFIRDKNKVYYSPLIFYKSTVTQTTSQKHLSIILDSRLTFDNHLHIVLIKTNEIIGLPPKLQNILSKPALITLYKAFARSQLDWSPQVFVSSNLGYGDIFYGQTYKTSFHQKLEKVQVLV